MRQLAQAARVVSSLRSPSRTIRQCHRAVCRQRKRVGDEARRSRRLAPRRFVQQIFVIACEQSPGPEESRAIRVDDRERVTSASESFVPRPPRRPHRLRDAQVSRQRCGPRAPIAGVGALARVGGLSACSGAGLAPLAFVANCSGDPLCAARVCDSASPAQGEPASPRACTADSAISKALRRPRSCSAMRRMRPRARSTRSWMVR